MQPNVSRNPLPLGYDSPPFAHIFEQLLWNRLKRSRGWRPVASDGPPASRTLKPIPQGLLEYMREWRRVVAQRQGVPAYIWLHDTSLEELCGRQPASLAELLKISGIGERKAELYGQQIFAALEKFNAGARANATVEKKISPAEETIQLLSEGRSFEEIAQIRDRQLG